ncbi:hypothetical protein PPYR_11820 [Photinus pyralis]|uniref:TLC domain-containing protein n=1 Tax=Photinus pyralis TaxID=7054 RepID=A0A5N4ACE5_PHOPY|nr:ceramide synthase 6-like [Photinus pyralis]KAB0794981.1 hypothetical protein PPYR_11820 [Photinus pyralis]
MSLSSNSLHLFYSIPIALVIFAVRYCLERCFNPIGKALGIKQGRGKAAQNNLLETSYAPGQKLGHEEILGLAKQLDWSEREVERWLRLRKNQDKPSTLDKFCESSWRVCYYFCFFILGVFVLHRQSWLLDINECWNGYPNQNLDDDIWWYIIIAQSYYVSLLISQFFDIKRKDFWQMFAHHIITITLMTFAWILRLQRITSLILLVHEFADIFLDTAKILNYARCKKLCDVIFMVFTALWIITRLGVYPLWIIRSTIWDAPKFLDLTSSLYNYYVFLNGLLLLILSLDIYWTYMLSKVICKFWNSGHVQRDSRSSSSENTD